MHEHTARRRRQRPAPLSLLLWLPWSGYPRRRGADTSPSWLSLPTWETPETAVGLSPRGGHGSPPRRCPRDPPGQIHPKHRRQSGRPSLPSSTGDLRRSLRGGEKRCAGSGLETSEYWLSEQTVSKQVGVRKLFSETIW